MPGAPSKVIPGLFTAAATVHDTSFFILGRRSRSRNHGPVSSGWSQSLAEGVLTLTGTKQSLYPATGDGPNGGCMRYRGYGTSRPG